VDEKENPNGETNGRGSSNGTFVTAVRLGDGVFGIGPQELMIIALLFLVVFGPRKASSMARDLGRFVNEARRPVEELKSELAAAGEHWNEPTESASDLHSGNGGNAARNRATKSAGDLGKGGAAPEDVGVPPE